jgi:hypothetical protein
VLSVVGHDEPFKIFHMELVWDSMLPLSYFIIISSTSMENILDLLDLTFSRAGKWT